VQPAPPDHSASLDAGSLRRYRIDLAITARRFRQYPTEALHAGRHGMAEIELSLTADGQPPVARLLRTSQYPQLDEAALAMITQAAAATALPPQLGDKTFRLSLPVEFSASGPESQIAASDGSGRR
jgi:protein TonB